MAFLFIQSDVVALEANGGRVASEQAVVTDWKADIRTGKYDSALSKLDKILSDGRLADKQKITAFINRGLVHQKLELHGKAVSDYSAALTMGAMSDRVRAIVIYNRGIAHQKLKRQARAIGDFTNALYLDAEFAHAYYGRARLMHELGRYEMALADFAKAMEHRHPSKHLPFYGQALAYQAMQRDAHARKALSRALLLKPDFKPALEKYQEISGVAFDPKDLILPANEMKVVDVPASNGANLPEPKAPSVEVLETSSAYGVVEASETESVERTATATDTEDARFQKRALRVAALGESAAPAVTGMTKVASTPARVESTGTKPDTRNVEAPPRTVAERQDSDEIFSADEVSGWLVQLNSQRSRDAAKAVWARYKKEYGSIFSKARPIIQKADLGSRGVYYRLRLSGYEAREEADRKCSQVKDKGLNCFVVKTG